MCGRPADLRFAFEHEPEAARKARHAAARLFTKPYGLVASAVILTVSELVTNAVIHGGDGGVLQIWDPTPDGRLRVEVEDPSQALPVPAITPDVAGRGLLIVDLNALRWGFDPVPAGKVVWAEFER